MDKRARQEAQENRPENTATSPDVHEEAITTYCRTLLRGLNTWYRAALSRKLTRQEQTAAHLAPERLEASYAAAPHELVTHAAQLHDPLSAARRRERRALREWKAFRDEHDLSREAEYPASRSLYYAVLAAMVLVEAAANAYFFARGSDYGLLGGLLEALLVAGVNVAMSFYVGVGVAWPASLWDTAPARPHGWWAVRGGLSAVSARRRPLSHGAGGADPGIRGVSRA